jgi:hypothetical protein
MQYKKADKATVHHYAEALMNKNGKTTNLEVKDAMRAENYWVDQSEIRDFMRDLSGELGWDVSSNGSYNTYSVAVITADGDSQSARSATGSKWSVQGALTDLFGIHRFAMVPGSRLREDLGLSDLQMQDLAMVIMSETSIDLPQDLMSPGVTVQMIQNYVDSPKKAASSGRVKINVEPIADFGGKGAGRATVDVLLKNSEVSDEDWVMSTGKPDSRMIYPGSESRDHVRTAYARRMRVRIQDTRAIRIKNFLK